MKKALGFAGSSSSKKVRIKGGGKKSNGGEFAEVSDIIEARELLQQLYIENEALNAELEDQRETCARNKVMLEEQSRLVEEQACSIKKATDDGGEGAMEMLMAESIHLKRLLEEQEALEKSLRLELVETVAERNDLRSSALSQNGGSTDMVELGQLRRKLGSLEDHIGFLEKARKEDEYAKTLVVELKTSIISLKEELAISQQLLSQKNTSDNDDDITAVLIKDLEHTITTLRREIDDKNAEVEDLGSRLQVALLLRSNPNDTKDQFSWQQRLDNKEQEHEDSMRKMMSKYEHELHLLRSTSSSSGTFPRMQEKVDELQEEVKEKDRAMEELTDQMMSLTDDLNSKNREPQQPPPPFSSLAYENEKLLQQLQASKLELNRLEDVIASLREECRNENKILRKGTSPLPQNFDWGDDVTLLHREIEMRTVTLRKLAVKNAQLEATLDKMTQAHLIVADTNEQDVEERKQLDAQVIKLRGEIRMLNAEVKHYKQEAHKAAETLQVGQEGSRMMAERFKREVQGYTEMLATNTTSLDIIHKELSEEKHRAASEIQLLRISMTKIIDKQRGDVCSLQSDEDTTVHFDAKKVLIRTEPAHGTSPSPSCSATRRFSAVTDCANGQIKRYSHPSHPNSTHLRYRQRAHSGGAV